jgi:hypothetical protein
MAAVVIGDVRVSYRREMTLVSAGPLLQA